MLNCSNMEYIASIDDKYSRLCLPINMCRSYNKIRVCNQLLKKSHYQGFYTGIFLSLYNKIKPFIFMRLSFKHSQVYVIIVETINFYLVNRILTSIESTNKNDLSNMEYLEKLNAELSKVNVKKCEVSKIFKKKMFIYSKYNFINNTNVNVKVLVNFGW